VKQDQTLQLALSQTPSAVLSQQQLGLGLSDESMCCYSQAQSNLSPIMHAVPLHLPYADLDTQPHM
jgi:hypothetical protein